MKKVLAVVAVVCVVFAAGAALAQPRANQEGRRVPPQLMKEFDGEKGHLDQRSPEQRFNRPDRPEPGRDGENMPCRFGGRRGGRMMFMPDMPEEIRAKAVEAAKLRIDLEAALSTRPIDKAKALEIFAKVQQAENEIEAWKFSKRIDMMEAFRTQRELNRKKFDAPKPEAPAPAPEEAAK